MNRNLETASKFSSEEWSQRESRVLAQAALRLHDPTYGPVFVRGAGSRLWDADGRDFIDLTCGYSANNFGHAFEPLITAATECMQRLGHLTQQPHPNRSLLAEQLLDICDYQHDGKVLFNVTGARAVESAWKAAVSFRPGRIISLGNAFHGRSLATCQLSSTARAASSVINVTQVEQLAGENFAYCAHCPLGKKYPSCEIACVDKLVSTLETQSERISALLVEPALGARGYVFPPAEYMRRLRDVTGERGIVLIADEVQMGLGRAGGWLLSQLQGWRPDLIVLGKSLGGGLVPISAVIGRAEILDSIPTGSESETYAANPLATGIALRVLSELKSGPWMQRGIEVGEQLRMQAGRIFRDVAPATIIEGVGACAAFDLVRVASSPIAASQYCGQVAKHCLEAGLLVHRSGPLGTRIVLIPAFTISDTEIHDALRRLTSALQGKRLLSVT